MDCQLIQRLGPLIGHEDKRTAHFAAFKGRKCLRSCPWEDLCVELAIGWGEWTCTGISVRWPALLLQELLGVVGFLAAIWAGGWLVRYIKLPELLGSVAVGIILGPEVLNIAGKFDDALMLAGEASWQWCCAPRPSGSRQNPPMELVTGRVPSHDGGRRA